jgi:hypothetical protein
MGRLVKKDLARKFHKLPGATVHLVEQTILVSAQTHPGKKWQIPKEPDHGCFHVHAGGTSNDGNAWQESNIPSPGNVW